MNKIWLKIRISPKCPFLQIHPSSLRAQIFPQNKLLPHFPRFPNCFPKIMESSNKIFHPTVKNVPSSNSQQNSTIFSLPSDVPSSLMPLSIFAQHANIELNHPTKVPANHSWLFACKRKKASVFRKGWSPCWQPLRADIQCTKRRPRTHKKAVIFSVARQKGNQAQKV